MPKFGRRPKYHNKPTVMNGITFDSKREAVRYSYLRALEKAGEITQLELQPKFPLLGADGEQLLVRSNGYPNGRRATYVADFRYRVVATEEVIVEDVKGVRTPVYKLKRAILERQGVRVIEV